MRHKVVMALQNLLENSPVLLSGIAKFDEAFVLDCYKGNKVPEEARPQKHENTVQRLQIGAFQMNISRFVQESSVMVMSFQQL